MALFDLHGPVADRPAAVSIEIAGDAEPDELVEKLDGLDRIVVNFATFKDGRGFSLARLLRDRYGFRGELRATGDLLPDQAGFLFRCGFDQVEIAERFRPETVMGAVDRYSVWYQPTNDGRAPVFALRHGNAAPAYVEAAE